MSRYDLLRDAAFIDGQWVTRDEAANRKGEGVRMSTDDGVWVGWSLEDGEPSDWYDTESKGTGPRIRVPAESWTEYQRLKQAAAYFEQSLATMALEEQRAWDAAHPPPPLSPAMQELRDVVAEAVERTLAKSLAFADHIARDYDKPTVGQAVNVRLPQRYRPK